MKQSKRRLQVCKFLEINPYGIDKFARKMEYSDNRIAFSRSDGSIEIWKYLIDTNYYIREYKKYGSIKYKVECLIWDNNGNLITGDTNGDIIIRSKTNFSHENIINNQYGSCIFLDYSPSKNILIAGFDQNIVCIINNSIPFMVQKLFHTNYQLTSVIFHPSGDLCIFATLQYIIQIYHFQNFKFVSLIDFSKIDHKRIVWTLLFLSDYTVIFGDSSGCVQFWDAYTSTLLKSFKCHKADVLYLCHNQTEDIIYSSSVDRCICIFFKSKNNLWNYFNLSIQHLNDITCLSYDYHTNSLISGAKDGVCFKFKAFNTQLHKDHEFGLQYMYQNIKINSNTNRVIYITNKYMQLWKISKIKNKLPKKLLQINNNSNYHCASSTISYDGSIISYSTSSSSRIYKIIKDENNKIKIDRIYSKPFSYIEASISLNNRIMAFVDFKKRLKVLYLSSQIFKDIQQLPLDSISFNIIFHESNNFLCIISLMEHTLLYMVQIDNDINPQVSYLCKISSYIMSSYFIQHLNMLSMVGFNTLYFYHLSSQQLQQYSLNIAHFYYISGIFYDHYSGSLILYNQSSLIRIPLPIDIVKQNIITDQDVIQIKCPSIINSAITKHNSIVIFSYNPYESAFREQPPLFIKKFGQT